MALSSTYQSTGLPLLSTLYELPPKHLISVLGSPLCHRSKEASVARRARRTLRTLEVHSTFEPSRVSSVCVAQAYEQVVPVTRRPLVHICPVIQAEHPRQKPHGGRKDIA